MPITPGNTGVPSIWWSRRKGCSAGSRVVWTTSPPWTPIPTTWPIIGPVVAVSKHAGSLPPDRWDAHLRRQHLDPRQLHHLRDRATRGHTDARPGSPVDDDGAGVRPGGAHGRRQL